MSTEDNEQPAEKSSSVARSGETTAVAGDAPARGLPARTGKTPLAKRPVIWIIALVAIGAIAFYGYRWTAHDRFIVWTNDAYVRADVSVIAPAVEGHIERIAIAENARVTAGDVLLEIDPGNYKFAVDEARSRAATQRARIARIDRQIEARKSEIAQARAERDAAQAEAVRAAAELKRTAILKRRAFTSTKLLENARATAARAQAEIRRTEAMVSSALANVAVLEATRTEAERRADEMRVALARAERDLAKTKIRAPFDGVIGNLRAKQGQYVEAGTRLLALIPLDAVYVEANFKETQLARIRPGRSVEITVDAFNGDTLAGKVESIAPAAGSEFALLPPDNATGNFTKIVKRVPVRIKLSPETARRLPLRAGLSVVVSVDTREEPRFRPTFWSLVGLDDRAKADRQTDSTK